MWICKLLGHNYETDWKEVSCDKLFGYPECETPLASGMYRVIKFDKCKRCGKECNEISVSGPFYKVKPSRKINKQYIV